MSREAEAPRPRPPLPDLYRLRAGGAPRDPFERLRRLESPYPAPRRGRRRRWWWGFLAVPVLIAAFFLWSVFGALGMVGNESFSAKWADWLRSHHASILVNHMEAFYYSQHAPKPGGAPKSLHAVPLSGTGASTPKAGAPSNVTGPTTTAPAGPVHLPPPAPLPLVVSPALPGEGQWQPAGTVVDGVAGMYEAQFRADSTYTSEITSAVWIDPTLMHVGLVPGLTDPGGTWSTPPYITPAELPTIAAAFNGGFRFADAKGGFYLNGVT
ncbi:MAG: hypothetical protein ACRDYC_07835, partial [Acidimicrobiales bacterium]